MIGRQDSMSRPAGSLTIGQKDEEIEYLRRQLEASTIAIVGFC